MEETNNLTKTLSIVVGENVVDVKGKYYNGSDREEYKIEKNIY